MFRQASVRKAVFGDEQSAFLCLDTGVPQDALAPYAGKVQAVYVDPPFLTGEDFRRRLPFGEEGWASGKPTMVLSAFTDRFPTREAYLDLVRGMLENARALLTDTGVLMLHLDWRASARARLLCDELFGESCFVNEVIWAYESGGRAKRTFSRKHDTILIYGKTPDWRLDPMKAAVPRSSRRRSHMKRIVDENGRPCSVIVSNGKEYRYYDDDPISVGDVWSDISHLQQRDPERNGWPTQKPAALLRRLLACVLEPGDLAADLCSGSGTTAAVARELGCRFLCADLAPEALTAGALRLRLSGFSLSQAAPSDAAALYGDVNAEGLLLLTGFDAANPALPGERAPLDSLNAWVPGRVTGDVFRRDGDAFLRSWKHPALPPMTLLNPGEGLPAVWTADAAGTARVFVWES